MLSSRSASTPRYYCYRLGGDDYRSISVMKLTILFERVFNIERAEIIGDPPLLE